MKRDVDTGTPTVLGWVDEGVGVIRLNRPERRNALHPDMYVAVPALIDAYDGDDEVGCILVTAAGTAFCAGGDVRDGAGPKPDGGSSLDPLVHMARMVIMLYESAKITMSALPGPAVGAGIGIALAADLRIAAEGASLVAGWGKLGLSGDFGGAWLLTRMLGASRALALLLGDDAMDAVEAERVGLFNRLVPAESLDEEAMQWARTIAAIPRTAARLTKQNVRDALGMSLREVLPLEAERMRLSSHTPEHRAAVRRWLDDVQAKERSRG
jgi:2-(1,2-epoxy-1,2-dihydrophenyl)acetyl-CoA isomerase